MVILPKSVLVLSPHTDDGELGAGGFINKLISQGVSVNYVAFSDCQESVPEGFSKNVLSKECIASTASLGIENTYIHEFKVRNFFKSRQEILDLMIFYRKKFMPDLVLLPSSYDIHQDHKVIYEEGVRAFKTVSILGYIFPWNCLSADYRCVVNLSDQDLDAKFRALSSYTSQSNRPYFQDNFISSWSSASSILVNGAGSCEVFECIRVNLL